MNNKYTINWHSHTPDAYVIVDSAGKEILPCPTQSEAQHMQAVLNVTSHPVWRIVKAYKRSQVKTKILPTIRPIKKYRLDLGYWETRFKLGFITYFKYEVFQGKTFYTIFRPKDKRRAKYFIFLSQPPITITKAEIDIKYQGNKWFVPVNFEII